MVEASPCCHRLEDLGVFLSLSLLWFERWAPFNETDLHLPQHSDNVRQLEQISVIGLIYMK
jgi:hypothetical protein